MDDMVEQAKQVFGIEDSPQQRQQELQDKKADGQATDRDHKELKELDKKLNDEQ